MNRPPYLVTVAGTRSRYSCNPRGVVDVDVNDEIRSHKHSCRHDYPSSRTSVFAFSSQYVMSILRYIVAAVARCCWACSRSPVRR